MRHEITLHILKQTCHMTDITCHMKLDGMTRDSICNVTYHVFCHKSSHVKYLAMDASSRPNNLTN